MKVIQEPDPTDRGTGHFDTKKLDDCALSEQVERWGKHGRVQIHEMIDLLIQSEDKFLITVAKNVNHLMYEYDRLVLAVDNGQFQLDKFDTVKPGETKKKTQGYL